MEGEQEMQVWERIRAYFLFSLSALILVAYTEPAVAQTNSGAAHATVERDGQHDFDPLIGTWKYHLKRRLNPLTGSTTWAEFEGTGLCRKVWDGRAELEQAEFHGPSGRIEGLVVRTYNPQTHQWSLNWVNSKDGIMAPTQIGQFKNGQGEFYAQDTLNGKLIYVRFAWTNLNTNSPHFEQAFSNDGGKTWEVNWITDQTRVSDNNDNESDKAFPPPPDSNAGTPAAAAERDGQHDFDFELGSWKIHLKRRLHPLTGSNTWVEFDGTSVTRKVWGGRAEIEEFETDGAGGHIEGLTLRTYNPQIHQWNLYWANSKDGAMAVPQIGQFKNGQGEFYGQDTLNGKSIFVRFVWSRTGSNSPHFEQSFSDDGGKTWEVNWITDQTRVSSESDKTPPQRGSSGPHSR